MLSPTKLREIRLFLNGILKGKSWLKPSSLHNKIIYKQNKNYKHNLVP